MSEPVATELPQRAVLSAPEGGFVVAFQDKEGWRTSPAPGIRSVEEADAQNEFWGVTPELRVAVARALDRQEWEGGREGAPFEANLALLRHVSVLTALVGAPFAFSRDERRSGEKGLGVSWSCDHGRPAVVLTWLWPAALLTLMEGHVPREIRYALIGYCAESGLEWNETGPEDGPDDPERAEADGRREAA